MNRLSDPAPPRHYIAHSIDRQHGQRMASTAHGSHQPVGIRGMAEFKEKRLDWETLRVQDGTDDELSTGGGGDTRALGRRERRRAVPTEDV